MKIPCPACAAKYSVADDKIQSRLAKIRCRKCGVTIVIDGTVSPVNVYVGEGGQKTGPANSLPAISTPLADDGASRGAYEAPAPDVSLTSNGAAEASGPGPNEYAVDIADNDQRNMTLDGVVAAYNAGLVTAETYVWKDGMADWQMLAEVPEIYDALHAAARSAPPRANNAFGRSASTDLFGGVDVAGAGGVEVSLGSDPPVVAGTGARNESSVLFSLSALTGTSVPGPSTSNGALKPGKRTEDSGLIDLQALTSASDGAGAAYAAAAPQQAFGGPALISAPLGGVSSSTMNGAFAGYATKRSSNKTGFIIGGSILIAACIGAIVFIVKSGEPTTPVTSADVGGEKEVAAQDGKRTAKAAAQPEPQEEATAEPEATAEQEPAATARTTATEKPEPAPTRTIAETTPVHKPTASAPRRNPPTSAPSKPTTRASSEEAPSKPAPAVEPAPKPAEPAKPPAKKACDCKPADLMCAMRCSASKK